MPTARKLTCPSTNAPLQARASGKANLKARERSCTDAKPAEAQEALKNTGISRRYYLGSPDHRPLPAEPSFYKRTDRVSIHRVIVPYASRK